MRIFKTLLSILLFICFITISNAQQSKSLDSLQKILQEVKVDTQKVNILIQLTAEYPSDPEKFLQFTQKALNLSKKCGFEKGLARAYINMGMYHNTQSNFNEAIVYFDSAQVVAQKVSYIDVQIASLGNAANTYCYIGNYSKGLEYYLSALELMKKIDKKEWIATANNNIGNIYSFQNDIETALKYYRDALKIFEEIKSEPGIALAMSNIGGMYNILKQPAKALPYFSKSIEICIKINDKPKLAEAYTNLAQSYSDMKNYQQAVVYYKKAMTLFNDFGDKNGYSTASLALAQHYFFIGDFQMSNQYLSETIEIAHSIGAKNTLMSAYNYQARIDSAFGNFSAAFENYKRYNTFKDSLFQETKQKQIAEMQTRFDTKEKEAENEILKAKETQNKQIIKEKEEKNKLLHFLIYISSTAFLLVVGIAFLLLKISKNRKAANHLLEFKNFEISQQKEEISAQAEYLEKANREISEKNRKIEDSFHEITASITYARRIQQAMLPGNADMAEFFTDHFIFYRPRDIVSGDFYWVKKVNDTVIFVVADCTGHGVPGAFVSMLGMALLNEITHQKKTNTAAGVLEKMRTKIEISLKQTSNQSEQKDGMDMALFAWNSTVNTLQFAGANSSLYHTRKGVLTEYRGVISPIGISVKPKPFENVDITVEKGDVVYLCSDGYYDQFNHLTKKKLKTVPFKNLLTSICQNSMRKQHEIIEDYFDSWKGDFRQIDDVLVAGIKL